MVRKAIATVCRPAQQFLEQLPPGTLKYDCNIEQLNLL